MIEVDPFDAGFGARAARGGIDADALHCGEVDEQSAVADAVTRDAVAAAAHRDMQSVILREIHRRDYGRRSAAAGDPRRPLVEHTGPQAPWRAGGLAGGARERAR